MSIAADTGVRLINVDRGRQLLDNEYRIANQSARPTRTVADPGIFPRPDTVIATDTVGSTFPDADLVYCR